MDGLATGSRLAPETEARGAADGNARPLGPVGIIVLVTGFGEAVAKGSDAEFGGSALFVERSGIWLIAGSGNTHRTSNLTILGCVGEAKNAPRFVL